MTRSPGQRRPTFPVLALGIRPSAALVTLAVVSTLALAEPGWQPVVATEKAPAKAPLAAPAAVPPAKPKVAPVAAPALPPLTEILPALADAETAAEKRSVTPRGRKTGETGAIEANAAKDYCANIASAAADARFIWHKKVLAEIEVEIAKRVALLEEKTAEYQKWVVRRDEFSKKANDTVLRIYARMRPDAAAVQLAALDEETAAAVLMKLEARVASLILGDMDTAQAARLTATISGAGKVAPPAPPPAAKTEAKKQ
jgi:flagellar motility protein MotE (MotC chaperone)